MKVIIAEKPSVAADIARVLGANNKEDGYFEGNGYQVTWAFGHLVRLKDTEAYGYSKNWDINSLPILPEKFELEVINEPYIKKQFSIIKSLFKVSSKICIATDAGREGELIFRYIYELTGVNKPLSRLWISSLTDEAIKVGFLTVKPAHEYENLYHSAKARNEADWMFGINATRAFTCVNNAGLLSLGRVQTPTLAMICKAYLENKNFCKEDYFTIDLLLEHSNTIFKAAYQDSFSIKSEAMNILQRLNAQLVCDNVEEKSIKEPAPLLFDLTSLQQEANLKLGFKAQKTLDIAQSLYEKHKLLTYPRTSSKYLSEDMKSGTFELLNKLSGWALPSQINVSVLKLVTAENTKAFNNAKVTDHHAIIPTNKQPVVINLSTDEQELYTMVIGRFIQAFMPVCVKEITKIHLKSETGFFIAKGIKILSPGWRGVIVGHKKTDEEQILPQIKVGENAVVVEKQVSSKKTSPPELLTEAKLLHLMETAGKIVTDEAAKEALKDIGIGTPATRASIIETLFKRLFIINKGKSLFPTETGLAIYNMIKHKTFASPELTGSWESKLNQIASGHLSHSVFDSEIRSYTREIVSELISEGANKIEPSTLRTMMCPKCKLGEIRLGKKAFFCSSYQNGCDFTIYKEIASKTLTNKIVEILITKGKTDLLKGFKNKAGKNFDAFLILDESYKATFKFLKR